LFLVVALCFIGFMFLGMPTAFAMLASSVIYILLTGQSVFVIVHRMLNAVNSFPLLAIPSFIMVGCLMNSTGITERIFRFAKTLVGHMSGGLAQVNIIASLIFSGTSGAALADVGGIGAVEMKAMTDAGYDKPFSASITIASATIGPIFPPSIPLVIFGAIAEVSIVDLLLGGIVPALLTVFFLMITTLFISKVKNYPKLPRRASLKEVGKEFLASLPAILSPVILILGLLSGVFSPTEAAAVTVLYVLFILKFVYKELTFKGFYAACKEALCTTAVIMLNVSGAAMLGWIMAVEQIPQQLSGYLLWSTDPHILLFLLNLLLLFVGCFMETTAALLLFTPILVPIMTSVGVDPVHLGLIVVYNLMIGLLTPPLGMSLYLASHIVEEPMENILKALVPYYVPLVLTLFIITYFPKLALFIPSLIH